MGCCIKTERRTGVLVPFLDPCATPDLPATLGSPAAVYSRAHKECGAGAMLNAKVLEFLSAYHCICLFVSRVTVCAFFRLVSDIDECSVDVGTHGCYSPASCRNTVGSYTCSCEQYYVGNGQDCSRKSFICCVLFPVPSII